MHCAQFETRYPAHRPEGEDWVLLAPVGKGADKVGTWHRVRKLKPLDGLDPVDREADHHQAMLARWSIVGPAYEAWKQGQALPVDGTPIAAWALLTPSQVDALKRVNVMTVEAIAEVSDSVLSQLRWPGARELPKLAKQFLEGASAAEKDRQILEMQERMAAMEEMLTGKMESPAPKKRRGRPPKNPEPVEVSEPAESTVE